MVPSSVRWLDGRASNRNSYYEQAIESAVRAHNPFQKTIGRWIIRRLSPDSIRSTSLSSRKFMTKRPSSKRSGAEAANVHIGTKRQVKNILKHLRRINRTGCVRAAEKSMSRKHEKDWRRYQKMRDRAALAFATE